MAKKTRAALNPDGDRLLMPHEVADIFRVDTKTVLRWAHQKRLTSIQTLGKHRRYRMSEVMALMAASEEPRTV